MDGPITTFGPKPNGLTQYPFIALELNQFGFPEIARKTDPEPEASVSPAASRN